MSNRRLDWSIGAMNKETGEKQFSVGGAWKNDDGTITIKLDPFVVLTGNRDVVITMFPREYTSKGEVKRFVKDRRTFKVELDADDEIPF